MDLVTYGAVLAAVKKIPGSAASEAIEAANRAEDAADLAKQYAYKMEIVGDTLYIKEGDE